MTEIIAADTETTGLNRWTGDRPFCLSWCRLSDETPRAVEVDVDPFTREPQWGGRKLAKARRVLGNPRETKRFFNLKFDVSMMKAVGVRTRGGVEEVSFMVKACNNLEPQVKLKPLADRNLDIDAADEDELRNAVIKARRIGRSLGWAVNREGEDPPAADYWMPRMVARHRPDLLDEKTRRHFMNVCRRYAKLDALRTLLLGEFYREGMKQLGVEDTYDFEMRLLRVTKRMEHVGAAVDVKEMRRAQREAKKAVAEAREELDRRFWPGFNPDSPPQLQRALYGEDYLNFPVTRRTKTGQPKTDARALIEHKQHPAVRAIFRHRANERALNTFFANYEKLAVKEKGGVRALHPSFRQWGTLTGRYSCSQPNMQQVSDPTTTNSPAAEFVVPIRRVFVSRPGKTWYLPDYSQVEIIIFADVSGEPALIEAIKRGDDVHSATAEKIWGGEDNPRAIKAGMELLEADSKRAGEDWMEEHGWSVLAAEKAADKKIFRKRGKSVTFTKIFGGGVPSLMEFLSCDYDFALQTLRDYDASFPTMVSRMRDIELRGKKDGCVFNPFGRRLAVDPWNAYRAVNHVVQSAAADLMKRGMLACFDYLRGHPADAELILTIHDELVFEIADEDATTKLLKKLKEIMSDHGGALSLPTPVDMDRAKRWSEKTGVEV